MLFRWTECAHYWCMCSVLTQSRLCRQGTSVTHTQNKGREKNRMRYDHILVRWIVFPMCTMFEHVLFAYFSLTIIRSSWCTNAWPLFSSVTSGQLIFIFFRLFYAEIVVWFLLTQKLPGSHVVWATYIAAVSVCDVLHCACLTWPLSNCVPFTSQRIARVCSLTYETVEANAIIRMLLDVSSFSLCGHWIAWNNNRPDMTLALYGNCEQTECYRSS